LEPPLASQRDLVGLNCRRPAAKRADERGGDNELKRNYEGRGCFHRTECVIERRR
jgi:hypothetical protein